MSLEPQSEQQPGAGGLPTEPQEIPRARRIPMPGRRFWTVCFAVFAFEIGLFLTVFPWMDSWSLNHLPILLPAIEGLWDDVSFKGAITGLGLINIYVAVNQIVTLIRERFQSPRA
jgi:hypothetical protein